MNRERERKPPKWILGVVLFVALGGAAYLVASKKGSAASGPHAPIVSALEKARRTADAEHVKQACAGERAASCGCRQEAAHRALDRNLHAEAASVLAPDAKCAAEPMSLGLAAEALARAEQHDAAIAKANEALLAQPNDEFASYALAHAHFAKGDITRAVEHAQSAVERGRGTPAHLLLGMIAYRAGDLVRAKVAFEKMLELDASDIDAVFNLAVVAGRENRYRDAREGYLKVLQLDPGHIDARYNLGLLTHSAGAAVEAQHHLKKLEEMTSADDHRVKNLRIALSRPAPGGPGVVSGQAEPKR